MTISTESAANRVVGEILYWMLVCVLGLTAATFAAGAVLVSTKFLGS